MKSKISQFIYNKLTKNKTKILMFAISFDYEKYKKNGENGSCDLCAHPALFEDKNFRKMAEDMVDYVRANHDMEKFTHL